MVAVVGAAVISAALRLAWWGYHAGANAEAKLAAITIPSIVTPLLLGVLVMATTPPGPRRDATLYAVCCVPMHLVGAAILLSSLGLLAYCIRVRPDLLPALTGRAGRGLFGMILGTSAGGWLIVGLGGWRFAPRQCPTCGRRALIRSGEGVGGGFRRRRPGEPTPPPPRPYGHYWCAACGARHKKRQLWAIPWEDASDRNDDRYYDFGVRRNRENRAVPVPDEADD